MRESARISHRRQTDGKPFRQAAAMNRAGRHPGLRVVAKPKIAENTIGAGGMMEFKHPIAIEPTDGAKRREESIQIVAQGEREGEAIIISTWDTTRDVHADLAKICSGSIPCIVEILERYVAINGRIT